MTTDEAREQLTLRKIRWPGKWYAIEVPPLKTWIFCRTKKEVEVVAVTHNLSKAIVMETNDDA